jgi:hypothetical protein
MDLHVKFTGLCLFVPDPEDASQTHVLMPFSRGMHKHTVKLQYAGGPSNIVIDKAWVDISVEGQTGNGGALPAEVIPVGRIVDRKIKKEQRNKKNVHAKLTAGFTLPRLGRVVPGETAGWELSVDGTTRRVTLTHQVTWIIRSIDESTLCLTHYVNGSEVPLPHPQSTGNEIHIDIEHLPADANYCLGLDEEARHFHMYLDVFDPGPMKSPKLKLKTPAPSGCTSRVNGPEGSEEKIISGSAFNCVVAQSDGTA